MPNLNKLDEDGKEHANPFADIIEKIYKIKFPPIRKNELRKINSYNIGRITRPSKAVLVVDWFPGKGPQKHASKLVTIKPDKYIVYETMLDDEKMLFELNPGEPMGYDEKLAWCRREAARDQDIIELLQENGVKPEDVSSFRYLVPAEPPESNFRLQANEFAVNQEVAIGDYQVAGLTNLGEKRDNNEDCFNIITFTDGSILMIIADGMGGNQDGEIASKAAVQSIGEYFLATDIVPTTATQGEINEIFMDSFSYADQNINKYTKVGGTTATAVLLTGDRYTVCHIGDSRLYSVDNRSQALTQVTEDDLPKVKDVISRLGLSEMEATIYLALNSNVILKNLGGNTTIEYSTPTISTGHLTSDSALLLCTDGLYRNSGSLLSDIAAIASSGASKEVVAKLIKYALDKGGIDNITAIMAQKVSTS